MRIKRRNIQIGDPNALIAKRYDMNVFTNSIPQNPKKSTTKAKKVVRKFLTDEGDIESKAMETAKEGSESDVSADNGRETM